MSRITPCSPVAIWVRATQAHKPHNTETGSLAGLTNVPGVWGVSGRHTGAALDKFDLLRAGQWTT